VPPDAVASGWLPAIEFADVPALVEVCAVAASPDVAEASAEIPLLLAEVSPPVAAPLALPLALAVTPPEPVEPADAPVEESAPALLLPSPLVAPAPAVEPASAVCAKEIETGATVSTRLNPAARIHNLQRFAVCSSECI
jgi:hypothetical protein